MIWDSGFLVFHLTKRYEDSFDLSHKSIIHFQVDIREHPLRKINILRKMRSDTLLKEVYSVRVIDSRTR
jgi:hypothetical protein